MMNELMTAEILSNAALSKFSLLVLESSGWYNVNYDNVELFTWG